MPTKTKLSAKLPRAVVRFRIQYNDCDLLTDLAQSKNDKWPVQIVAVIPCRTRSQARAICRHPFGWIAFEDRHPTKANLPLIAGSFRNGEWTVSSVWDRLERSWDADRTHWFSVPKPPALNLAPK